MRKSLDQRKSVARVPQGHLSAELAPPVPRPSNRPWQRDNKWPYCYRWLTPISSMPVSEEGITLQPSLIWRYGHTREPSQYCPGFILGGGVLGGWAGVTSGYFTLFPSCDAPFLSIGFLCILYGDAPLEFLFAPYWNLLLCVCPHLSEILE